MKRLHPKVNRFLYEIFDPVFSDKIKYRDYFSHEMLSLFVMQRAFYDLATVLDTSSHELRNLLTAELAKSGALKPDALRDTVKSRIHDWFTDQIKASMATDFEQSL